MSKSLISGLKVLLADDSVTMHRAVSLALRKLSCDLMLADNGGDAERIIREQLPDVVLLDWDLPEKSGLELCREIKSNLATESIKVILLLSSFEKIDEAELNSVPSDARLWKPFEANVLQTMIETLIKNDQSKIGTPSLSAESTAPGLQPPANPGSSRPVSKSTFEETAPLARSPAPNRPSNLTATLPSPPSIKPPGVPPPIGRNLNPPSVSNSPQSRTRAVEATTPPTPTNPPPKRRSVDDLFSGPRRETPQEDLTQELTTETFRANQFPEDSSEETNESQLDPNGDLAEEMYEPEMLPLTPHDHEAIGNIHNTINEARNQILGLPSNFSGNSPGNSSVNDPSEANDEHLWGDPVAEETAPSMPRPPGVSVSLAADDVRRIISEELEIKFRKWLKEEVESQLARVLKELNGT